MEYVSILFRKILCVCVCVCVYIYLCVYTYMCVCMHVCACVYVCMRVLAYACAFTDYSPFLCRKWWSHVLPCWAPGGCFRWCHCWLLLRETRTPLQSTLSCEEMRWDVMLGYVMRCDGMCWGESSNNYTRMQYEVKIRMITCKPFIHIIHRTIVNNITCKLYRVYRHSCSPIPVFSWISVNIAFAVLWKYSWK